MLVSTGRSSHEYREVDCRISNDDQTFTALVLLFSVLLIGEAFQSVLCIEPLGAASESQVHGMVVDIMILAPVVFDR
jgi:hypothetical protein